MAVHVWSRPVATPHSQQKDCDPSSAQVRTQGRDKHTRLSHPAPQSRQAPMPRLPPSQQAPCACQPWPACPSTSVLSCA
jgi:hypothetical protein